MNSKDELFELIKQGISGMESFGWKLDELNILINKCDVEKLSEPGMHITPTSVFGVKIVVRSDVPVGTCFVVPKSTRRGVFAAGAG